MGILTGIAMLITFVLLFKFAFKKYHLDIINKNGSKLDSYIIRTILSLMFAGSIYMFMMMISLFMMMAPIKNVTISKKTDTTIIHPFQDQTYFMIKKKSNGQLDNISYFEKGEICTRTLEYWSSAFSINLIVKFDSIKNYKYDSTRKMFLPYIVKYEIGTKDSTIQKLIFGYAKKQQIDTLFLKNKKLIKYF